MDELYWVMGPMYTRDECCDGTIMHVICTPMYVYVSNLTIQMGVYMVACGMPPPPYEAPPYEILPQLFDFDIILGVEHLPVAKICILTAAACIYENCRTQKGHNILEKFQNIFLV